MKASFQTIAATDGTILITGRTGTGKSHLARQLHDLSRRRLAKFMAINLATLSENLIESELFGHERGAFSGADTKRIGKLEAANGGTVFLDEIGELPLRIQTKLLEALNSRTICPVGSNREIQLNVRIIAATNKNLIEQIKAGLFREDLYFRLNTFEISLPDLASQPNRLVELALIFAKEAAKQQGRAFEGLADTFTEALKNYAWPGNVRELRNAMEYAIALSPSSILECDCLPAIVTKNRNPAENFSPLPFFPTDYREAKQQFERLYLQEILARFQGKVNLTAKESGLSKVTLIDKIRRYNIDVPTIKYNAHQNRAEALV
jgi:DNA-binding NtrC family response regulator